MASFLLRSAPFEAQVLTLQEATIFHLSPFMMYNRSRSMELHNDVTI